MTGQIIRFRDSWFWRRDGLPDLPLRHNEWAKTPPGADMPRLAAPLADLERFVGIARNCLADAYFAVWNDTWKSEGDAQLTREAFMDRLTLTEVGYPDAQYLHGHFALVFDDGGLFSGHSFFVTFALDGRLVTQEMFG